MVRNQVRNRIVRAARWLKAGLPACVLLAGGCLFIHVERSGENGRGGLHMSFVAPGSLSESFATDFHTTWQAAHGALADMNVTVQSATQDGNNDTIQCVTADNEHCTVQVNKITPRNQGEVPAAVVQLNWVTTRDATAGHQVMANIQRRANSAATANAFRLPETPQPVVQAGMSAPVGARP